MRWRSENEGGHCLFLASTFPLAWAGAYYSDGWGWAMPACLRALRRATRLAVCFLTVRPRARVGHSLAQNGLRVLSFCLSFLRWRAAWWSWCGRFPPPLAEEEALILVREQSHGQRSKWDL